MLCNLGASATELLIAVAGPGCNYLRLDKSPKIRRLRFNMTEILFIGPLNHNPITTTISNQARILFQPGGHATSVQRLPNVVQTSMTFE